MHYDYTQQRDSYFNAAICTVVCHQLLSLRNIYGLFGTVFTIRDRLGIRN